MTSIYSISLLQTPRLSEFAWFLCSLIYLCLGIEMVCAEPVDSFQQGMEALNRGDYAEAFCIFRPLANSGHAEAQYNLGWLYANGNGLRVNMTEAIHWWKQAAENNHWEAAFALGLAFAGGEGIRQNKDKAIHWYLRAARHGYEDAQEILKNMLINNDEKIKISLDMSLDDKWLGNKKRVKVNKANLRSGRSIQSPIITALAVNSEVIVLLRQGAWARIATGDPIVVGWMHVDLID